MEDWLYAAGWDKATLKECAGIKTNAMAPPFLRSNSGGSKSRMLADDSEKVAENRALVFLVETSNKKVINDDTLGDSLNVSGYYCVCYTEVNLIFICLHRSWTKLRLKMVIFLAMCV